MKKTGVRGSSLNLRWVIRLLLLAVLMNVVGMAASVSADDSLSGKWCVENDAGSCAVVINTGDSIHAETFTNGKKDGEWVGFVRGKMIVVAFRRLDIRDMGYWLATVENGRMTGKSHNPDGSQRWKGTFIRR